MRRFGGLRGLIACRVCWKITAAVFLLILVVESVLLVPSALRFQREEITRLANRAAVAAAPTLALTQRLGPQGLTAGLEALIDGKGIVGIAVYDIAGMPLAAVGESSGLAYPAAGALSSMPDMSSRSPDGSRLDAVWRSDGGQVVVARLDSSGVHDALIAYLWRIAGLIAAIVLVVTAGTMMVVHVGVLKSVLRLRGASRASGADPINADRHILRTRRRDEIGELIGDFNAMLLRIAEGKRQDRRNAEERVRFLTRHERLTGLPNREALIEHIDGLAAVAAGPGRCVSLLLVDIARFRVLNASYGQQRCDELLREFSLRLRRASPARDFIAHLGADRFAVVHDAAVCSPEGVAGLAERILAVLSARYDVGGASIASLDARIGIGRSEDRAPEGRPLLNEAEQALDRTADTEGPRYSFYSAELAERARERQDLAHDLERALAGGELFPVLQPKMALGPNGGVHLSGAEALLRWKHPQRGFVRPDIFIPIAEASGLMAPIGEFMLGEACRAMRGWQNRHGRAPRIAVNLSAQQFADPALPAQISRVLASAQLAPRQLELEITETAAMKDADATARTLGSLRALGVRVSIDDFGTGYSSLAYLRRFAVDAIKIDKSFVDDIGDDANADAVCDAIIRLGRAIGTKVIAEGVENERQVTFLRQRRCDEVQGYFFGRPVPLEDFEREWIALRAAA